MPTQAVQIWRPRRHGSLMERPSLIVAAASTRMYPPAIFNPYVNEREPVVASEAAFGRPPLGCAFEGTTNRIPGTTEMDYDDA